MRPKFSMWSDYGAPAQRQWISASKRGTGSSVGPKILLAAVVVVAGVIGISGIYPQVIDAEWVQDTGTHLPIMSLSTAAAKRTPSTAAATLSPQRRVATTTGQSAGPSPRSAPPPELPRTSAPSVPSPANAAVPAATPIAVADIPDAEAKADALPPDPAPAAKAAEKPTEKPKAVAKKKVVVVHHQRSFGGAYAQYGGWGGWGSWGGFGGFRRY